MEFKVVIDLANDAFQLEEGSSCTNGRNGTEIARILREIANAVDGNVVGGGDVAVVRDANGNTAATWWIA